MKSLEIIEKIKSGQISAVTVVKDTLKRIEAKKDLNAFITVFEQRALQKAEELDAKIAAGKQVGALAGLPISLKDNIAIAGQRMTCGSVSLQDYRSPFDATVVEHLESEDAIIIGKTNLDEFAMGATGEYSCFGASINPLDSARVPGGSSSGAAVSVAGGMVPVALGSETGGSVRLPACYCGLVGLKPTYGSVSRYGLTAFSSSLDQIGVLSHSVADNKLIFDVIKGGTNRDMTSKTYPKKAKVKAGKDLVIGLPQEYFDVLDKDLSVGIYNFIEKMKAQGFRFKSVSVPSTKFAVPTYYVLTTAELSSNLSRFDGVRYSTRKDPAGGVNEMIMASRSFGFGTEVKRRIMLGTFVLSAGYFDAYYGKALQAKANLEKEFSDLFAGECDVLLAPVANSLPPKLGERCMDPVQMYNTDVFTCSANIAGIPALSVPIQRVSEQTPLPQSVQLMGDNFSEEQLFALGQELEKIVNSKA